MRGLLKYIIPALIALTATIYIADTDSYVSNDTASEDSYLISDSCLHFPGQISVRSQINLQNRTNNLKEDSFRSMITRRIFRFGHYPVHGRSTLIIGSLFSFPIQILLFLNRLII